MKTLVFVFVKLLQASTAIVNLVSKSKTTSILITVLQAATLFYLVICCCIESDKTDLLTWLGFTIHVGKIFQILGLPKTGIYEDTHASS